jgi:lipopolysaccharide/colanic/teichoic acid biosynthesis glycosyltransferase
MRIHPIVIALFDLLLLVVSFLVCHLMKYGTLAIEDRHTPYIYLVLLSWLALSLIQKKFTFLSKFSLTQGLNAIALTAVMMAGLVSLFIVMLGLIHMSRMLVYGTFFLFAGLELASFLIYYGFYKHNAPAAWKPATASPQARFRPSVSLWTADALLLIASILLATYFKRGEFEFTDTNVDIMIMFIGLWMLTSLVLRKFHKDHFHRVYSALAISIKSTLVMSSGLAMIIVAMDYYYLSRAQIFGALLIFAVAELGLFYLYHRWKAFVLGKQDSAFLHPVQSAIHCRQPDASTNASEDAISADAPCADPVDEKIRHALHFLEPELYGFIREFIDLDAIDSSQAMLMHSDNLVNIGVLEAARHRLVININKINDMRFLNQYFLLAHAKLTPKGFLVGKAHTLDTHRAYFFRQFPPEHGGHLLYALDFIWNRVCPKLPVIQKFYFAVTKGRNRLLSRAEILGRLFFCGFEPIAEKEISDRLYFIVQKTRTPSEAPDPTYGPLVTLHRFGMHNHPIKVYKFRTMHPYSEYLQEYVYDKNHLEDGGKFKDDFRITTWGMFMRKHFIDELPMLYNWLRGDLQFVGVRPLSGQYIDLYSPEMRELRKQVKPGLLPPYYADMPKTIDEIMFSERRYIEAYLNQPMRTQIVYFFRTIYNILVKRARSG